MEAHLETIESLRAEVERLKEWQESATGVLNKWYKCSEFLAEKSLVTLGDNYSEKCLEVLKSLTEQVEKLNKEYTELAIKFEDKNFELSQLKAERKEMVEALRELCKSFDSDEKTYSDLVDEFEKIKSLLSKYEP